MAGLWQPQGEVEHGNQEARVITIAILEPGGEGRQVLPPPGRAALAARRPQADRPGHKGWPERGGEGRQATACSPRPHRQPGRPREGVETSRRVDQAGAAACELRIVAACCRDDDATPCSPAGHKQESRSEIGDSKGGSAAEGASTQRRTEAPSRDEHRRFAAHCRDAVDGDSRPVAARTSRLDFAQRTEGRHSADEHRSGPEPVPCRSGLSQRIDVIDLEVGQLSGI